LVEVMLHPSLRLRPPWPVRFWKVSLRGFMLQKVTTTDDGLHVYRSRRAGCSPESASSLSPQAWRRQVGCGPRPEITGFVAEFGGPGHPLISMHEEDPAENEGYLNARSAWIVLGPVFVYVAVVLFLRRAKRNRFTKGRSCTCRNARKHRPGMLQKSVVKMTMRSPRVQPRQISPDLFPLAADVT